MIDVMKIGAFTTLELGRVGENEFRSQQIDVSAWLHLWPGATVSAVFSRPDGQLYTVVTDVTTSPLTWTPGTADLAVSGDGKLELRIITADGIVGKSAIVNTVTHGSLGAAGDPPTPPAPDWTETVAENATEARTAATDAQQAAQAASDAQQAINTAEPARVEAEQERVTAESERASAESDRATAESNRSTAESGRQTAENNRATAEQNRATAETNRANAESARGTAETNRVNAETIRGDNEDTRQSNESTRQQNEAARVTAEQNRQGQIDANTASISELSADVAHLKVVTRRKYGIKWDMVNATCTRLYDAADITVTTTNFGHFGAVNVNYNNPFDNIYPWRDVKLCNIDITAYMALVAGARVTDCVLAWEGDADFSYTHENGVWRYCPEFYYKAWDEGGYRYIAVSDGEVDDWIKSPARIQGRYFGITESRTIGGVSKTILLPKVGIPSTGPAMSSLHTYAKNAGMTLENIYSIDADTVLFAVEYANLNSQTAIGNGVHDLYQQSGYTIQTAATASTVVQILSANAGGDVIAGAIMDIGTSDGSSNIARAIVVSTVVNGTYLDVTLDRAVTVAVGNYWSIHGLSNVADTLIGGKTGYIGANGKSNAYYRGVIFHSNFWRYVLGAYRQTGTGEIWKATDEVQADAYDALNTAVHTDTGLALTATAGYVKTLGLSNGLALVPFCTTVGGDSAKPVGDYCYVPSLATANTVLLLGGNCNDGANDGRFCGDWGDSASDGNWRISAFPLLKSP